MALEFVPILAVLALAGFVALAPFSRRVDVVVTRVAYTVFDGADVERNTQQEQELRSAAIGTPYRVYVTKTKLYTVVGVLVGGVVGVYLAAALVSALVVSELTLPTGEVLFQQIPPWLTTPGVKRFLVFAISGSVCGALSGGLVHSYRWQVPSMRAGTRRRQIDASMPRMVAFIYALSRGGMSFPDVMRALAANRGVFGAGADEMEMGVRNIDVFGTDQITTIRQISERTPSNQFRDFTQDLTNVLRSGRDLSAFLREQYERYRERAEEQQREILELLATTAEIYVTVVVAGMLFLITILLVIGLTSGDTLVLIQLITYLVLPATNLVFVAYLAEITQPLRATRDRETGLDREEFGDKMTIPGQDSTARADGGAVSRTSLANLDRLRAYERLKRFRTAIRSPFKALIEEPSLILFVTVPLAVLFVVSQLPLIFSGGTFDLRAFDDVVILASLFLMSTFAVLYERSRRRLERLEESVPDLLERLAGLNEAGVSVVTSFDRVRRTDVGDLSEEVEHIWRDIQWGATVEQALHRFETRVRTPAVTRVVTLITNAMAASNDIGPVLRIAAEQARSDRRLKRQRRQEMFTYLVVVYVAFVVFLVVIVAIDSVLIPNLPDASTVEGAAQGAGTATSLPSTFVGIASQKVEAYRLVFFHAALIQAALSGLVGGQMSGASVKDGVKHSTIMVTVTYVVFLVL